MEEEQEDVILSGGGVRMYGGNNDDIVEIIRLSDGKLNSVCYVMQIENCTVLD